MKDEQRSLDIDAPIDPVAQAEQHFKKEQRRAAALLREHFAGSGGPQGWSNAADLGIWKRLAKVHGPEQVNGAITVARDLMRVPQGYRMTMLVFNGDRGRQFLERCVQEWRKRCRADGEDAKVSNVLRNILRPTIYD